MCRYCLDMGHVQECSTVGDTRHVAVPQTPLLCSFTISGDCYLVRQMADRLVG